MPREPHSYQVEAVVLRHSDWGEADRLLGLFTREKGKLRVIAKGAREDPLAQGRPPGTFYPGDPDAGPLA